MEFEKKDDKYFQNKRKIAERKYTESVKKKFPLLKKNDFETALKEKGIKF